MEAVVLVIHLIVALAIIAVVLLQPAESGGFLGSSGSMSNLMVNPRRSGDVLTRLTTVLAGIFFATSLILAVMAENRAPKASILDAAASAPVEAPQPEKPAAPISK